MAPYKTIREAAQAWVGEFIAIPHGICVKLLNADSDELREITPPSANDRVYVFNGDYDGNEGTVIRCEEEADDDADVYLIELDDGRECEVRDLDFEVQYDDALPMWGMLWAFGNQLDNDWLAERGGLRFPGLRTGGLPVHFRH